MIGLICIFYFSAPIFVTLGQHFTERGVVIFGAVFGCIIISLCYFKTSIVYLIVMYGLGAGKISYYTCIFIFVEKSTSAKGFGGRKVNVTIV